MGFFDLKTVCGVCGKEVGWNRYKIAKSDAWCCPDCLKKAKKAYGKPIFVNAVTINDLKKIIDPSRNDIVEEYRRKCNVCGKIYCFTESDIVKNNSLRKEANSDLVSSIFVPVVMAGSRQQQADAKLSKIVDYSRCPNCNSTDVVDITEEEFNELQRINSNNFEISSADELKKYKDLLDSGVITQEEFDAKKKQLLGI